jgi:hypothetical protein
MKRINLSAGWAENPRSNTNPFFLMLLSKFFNWSVWKCYADSCRCANSTMSSRNTYWTRFTLPNIGALFKSINNTEISSSTASTDRFMFFNEIDTYTNRHVSNWWGGHRTAYQILHTTLLSSLNNWKCPQHGTDNNRQQFNYSGYLLRTIDR